MSLFSSPSENSRRSKTKSSFNFIGSLHPGQVPAWACHASIFRCRSSCRPAGLGSRNMLPFASIRLTLGFAGSLNRLRTLLTDVSLYGRHTFIDPRIRYVFLLQYYCQFVHHPTNFDVAADKTRAVVLVRNHQFECPARARELVLVPERLKRRPDHLLAGVRNFLAVNRHRFVAVAVGVIALGDQFSQFVRRQRSRFLDPWMLRPEFESHLGEQFEIGGWDGLQFFEGEVFQDA